MLVWDLLVIGSNLPGMQVDPISGNHCNTELNFFRDVCLPFLLLCLLDL